ncbi:uncharacterized protein LOC119986877 [Tripterygium wilfordii]|uniref:uncharacterized protein LOC119986877 n=1 Tax=Tripterygium wilfordii TaxID=458696 RepID=UPI0018F84D5C|nr:uncharacterized protein LOC119986877 [Tripterygium wilfordii]
MEDELKVHARFHLLLWKIIWDILPTRARLSGILYIPEEQQLCPICNLERETLDHLMFGCLISLLVWSNSRWITNVPTLVHGGRADWVKVLMNPNLIGISREDCQAFQLLALVTFDQTWRYRNDVLHGTLVRSINLVVAQIQHVHNQHCQAWRISRYVQNIIHPNWVPPPLNWIKVNFDTVMGHNFTASAAIARSLGGDIIFASVSCAVRVDPAVGEALALRLGVQRGV